jgi:hypothetical protein
MAFELIDTAWDKIIDRAVAARSPELRVICPFIKRKVAERLLRGPRLKSIQVLTRFHLGDFYDGVSDTEALQLVLESGAPRAPDPCTTLKNPKSDLDPPSFV